MNSRVLGCFRFLGLRGVAAIPVLALAAAGVTAPVAMAQDRPTGVANEKTAKKITLNADGSLSARTRLECDPGWESSDFTFSVSQGGVRADGIAEPSIPCDGRWHLVQYSVPAPGTGAFHPGKAQFSGQFLVFNVESGDPAAAHEQKTVSLHRQG